MIGKKPARIDWAGTFLLNESILPTILKYAKPNIGDCMPIGYNIYAVNQHRGRCYHTKMLITVPSWVFKREFAEDDAGYVGYYLCHELAHAYSWIYDNSNGHDAAFYKWFKKLCKPAYQHYELEYKPQNAAAAGIQQTVESLGL